MTGDPAHDTMKWPPDDPQRHNEQVKLGLFELVTEFLEVEGLTAQCADFVQARLCGHPYEPMHKLEGRGRKPA